jgi:hypothetical protein
MPKITLMTQDVGCLAIVRMPYRQKRYELTLLVGFVVITSVFMKFSNFCDTALCSPYVNSRFGRSYRFLT